MLRTPPPPDTSHNTSTLLDSPGFVNLGEDDFPELPSDTSDFFDDIPWVSAPGELAKLREQLTQTQNVLAQKEEELAQNDERLTQTEGELASTQAALQEKIKENEQLWKLNDLLFQQQETYQNIEKTQPVSTHQHNQDSSVGSMQQPQRSEETPPQRSDPDEMIRESEARRIINDPATPEGSLSTDVSNIANLGSFVRNNSDQSDLLAPSATPEGNTTRSQIEADTVLLNVHYEEEVQSTSEASTASSNQCASSSVNVPRASRQNHSAGARQRTPNNTSTNRQTRGSMRHSTHPVPVELPNGFHEIDLNSLVKSQKRLKTGRPIPILDGRGRSFAKELNVNQLPARGKMHMGLACRSKHGYYLPLFELGGRNATDPDHITCDFQREGSKRQKIKIGNLTMIKLCDGTFYKSGEQKRDGRVVFSLTRFSPGDQPEKKDVVGKTNKDVIQEYSLKEPRLIIWFTDESGRIYRPTSDVTGPAMQASVDLPLTTPDRVPSAVPVSFDSSNFCTMHFSLDLAHIPIEWISSGHIWLQPLLITEGKPSALYFLWMGDVNSHYLQVEQQYSNLSLIVYKHTVLEIKNDPALQRLLSIENSDQNGLEVAPPLSDDEIRWRLNEFVHQHFSVQYQLIYDVGDPNLSTTNSLKVNNTVTLGEYIETDEPTNASQGVEPTIDTHRTVNYEEEQQRPAKRPIDAVGSDNRLPSQKAARIGNSLDE